MISYRCSLAGCLAAVLLLAGCPNRPPGAPPAQETLQSVDLSHQLLPRFTTDGQLRLLRRHLATSARWRLAFLDEGDLAAVRREPRDEWADNPGALRASPDGISFRHQPWRRFRAMIRLAPTPAAGPPGWEAAHTAAQPGDPFALLRMTQPSPPDHLSYLVLGTGEPLGLEVLEESLDTSRETTVRLLREVNEELTRVLEGAPVMDARGYLAGTAPATSVRPGKPWLRVEKGQREGTVDLVGYVNPGREGSVYLSALRDGKSLGGEELRRQSEEFVGWSSRREVQFFYNAAVYLEELIGPGPARLELWFQPLASGGPVRLLEIPYRPPA